MTNDVVLGFGHGKEVGIAIAEMERVVSGEKEYGEVNCAKVNLDTMILEATSRKLLYSVATTETEHTSFAFYKNPYYEVLNKVFVMLRDGPVPDKDSPLLKVFLWWACGVWGNPCRTWRAIHETFDLESLQELVSLHGAMGLTQGE